MHRFRKKSDAKRSALPSSATDGHEGLPELPSPNDFRTSLILPDLSRRFSLLRSSTGDPVSLDLLRTRLANQRERGAQNQISEEEEDMLLETLGRLRSRNSPSPSPGASQEHVVEGEDGIRNSVRSTGTSTSSVTSSPSRPSKRYSNNLFGSGRLRDYNYLRSVASSKGSSSSTRTVSLTPTEASIATTRDVSSSSLRPVTPETSDVSISLPPSPNEKDVVRSAPLVPPAPYGDSTIQVVSAAEYRLQKTLGPAVLKRASLALEQAIKEIEDEVEDEILLPRSVPVPRGSLDQPTSEVRNSHASNTSSVYEAGMAISIDQTIHDEFSERRQSPIPARTVPGYVPGMPRPMTPRDFEFDEQRSHSTTPRAQSPLFDPQSPALANISSTTKIRRESTSSTARPSPITPVSTPLFLQRSTNGRFTPDDSHRSGGGDSMDFDSSFNSSLNSSALGRRRPASPLSGPPYQPMAAAVTNRPTSRPSTPSNVIWTPNINNNNAHKSNHSGHSRNNSWTTDGGVSSSDYHGHHNSKPGPRSLRSPALPESPTLDFGLGALSSSFAFGSNPPASNGNGQTASSEQPHAYIPDVELGSPLLAAIHAPRSLTPTQTAQRSPISPTFSHFDLSAKNGGGSRRSSRQNPPSSPFNISSFPSLGFSPRANSSRSSLDSLGSSFHSWDEPDKVLSVFSDAKEQQPAAWHDFDREQSSSVTPGGSGSPDEEDWDAEEVIQKYGGLKKADIAAVQEKLVSAAFAKLANMDRAPSALRRRRPSTSQSNYSRIASPPPQTQTPASPSPFIADDHFSKASALLNSVVDSIKEQPAALNTTAAVPIASPDDQDISPNTRRNRDLAHVLFGTEDDAKEDTPTEEEAKPEPEPVFTPPPPTTSNPTQPIMTPAPITLPTMPPTILEPPSPFSSPSPYLLLRNPSMPRIPQTAEEQAELAREVQEKTDAAMIALNKNPSRTNLGDSLKHAPSVRSRRVDTSQISTPKFVSTTTSVETIPLRSPSITSTNNPGPSKLGSRFKKLRGSLRAKNIVSSGEETVTPETIKTPPASQTAYYDPAKLNPPGAPKLSSATETGRFKVPLPSPPASAGPGLKGFMARFRNKQRMSEMPSVGERTMPRATSPLSPLSPTTPVTPRQAEPTTPKPLLSPADRVHNLTPRSAGQPRPMYSRFPPANPAPAPAPPQQIQAQPAEMDASQSAAALEQLFRAANNLGLDENALNDLLARSGSTSSRNLLSRNTSAAASAPKPGPWTDSEGAQPVTYVASTGSDQTATPTNYGNASQEQQLKPSVSDVRPVTPDETVTRKPSTRKADHLRRPKEGQTENAANAVVRRTIIYANDVSTADFSALVQRKNSARRKRASVQSTSNRSVHDRAPTPPPPKSPTVKRFSADGLPPMPQMPNFLGQADKMLNAPSTSAAGPIEKSNSTYDSLYDMYAGESRATSALVNDPSATADQQSAKGEPFAASEPGPALEVIELANGETIWNIVNGLRDGDDESIYSGRTSFASEYSSREHGNDGLQPFMKEHARSGSRGSVSSFVSKKKPLQGKIRPETKVFYSSSARIGQLIESLSQGADAGSFNFLPNLPNHGPGHSASSSVSTNDINWTVEERLDRMLGAMNAS
ncbi:hypothetical protein GALMADRAFT_239997 [Galerina marginata CBS 339.88]|uniref:Uncharacterized protein n=1 Tax=Galerina marginata (strain CBS 339.88) TaxID=685588 RepID=A0A067TPF1_GALM3|nr:hypothetical protein GALMADRAFT_239997 [Galerina marginata CBS 339.88]